MKTRDLAIYFIIFCALFEIAFHRLSRFWQLYDQHNPEHFWKTRFVEKYEAGAGEFLHPYWHHPTRGWALTPNLKMFKNGMHVTTNDQGFRSAKPFRLEKDKLRILVVGDSFTFGNGVGDSDTWPQLLEDRLPHAQVFNLGIDGYGMDQMLITLKETAKLYQPHIVICAFIDDDMARNLLGFRDYVKPRFELSRSHLVLKSGPIPNPQRIYEEVKKDLFWEEIALFQFPRLMGQLLYQKEKHDQNTKTAFLLANRLAEEMDVAAHDVGARFGLLHLTYGGRTLDNGDVFMDLYRRRHPASWTLTTRQHFHDYQIPLQEGHYSPTQTRAVAQYLANAIRWTQKNPPGATRAPGGKLN